MPDFINATQTTLATNLMILFIAGFLTNRIVQIRSIVKIIFDRLGYVNDFVTRLVEIRTLVASIKLHLESMMEDNKFDEKEVQHLHQKISDLYATVRQPQ